MFHYRRPHEAAPATLSGSGISTLPSRHGRGLKPRRPRNSSVPPGRPVKATGSPPKRVLGVGGSAGGQPRGKSSTGRVQNVRRSRPGSNQSDRGSLGDWAKRRRETSGVNAPSSVFTVSTTALVLGAPGETTDSPDRAGVVRRQCMATLLGSVPLLLPATERG